MKHLLPLGVVVMWSLGFGVEVAQEVGAPIVYAREPEPPEEVLIEVKIDWTQERIQQEIETVAAEYGVSSDVMNKVIKCESTDPETKLASTTIQSYHIQNGKRERSFGLSQINLDWHPTVSYEQATDPAYAIDFLARHLAQGKGNLWTCYRMLK